MYKRFRQFIFLLVGIVFRWPLWLIIGIAGKLGIFRLVFLVYPTDEIECSQFCPDISLFRRYFSGRPTPGGLIADGWKPLGLYFVIPDLPMDLSRKKNHQLAVKIVERMRRIRKLTGAQTIGLAGQLGPIFERRHNIKIEPPFFSSINGNIFSIHEAVKWAIPKRKPLSKQTRIAITGGGELGESLSDYLGKQGFLCDTADVRFSRRGEVLPVISEKTRSTLERADIVINLLPKGTDFTGSDVAGLIGKDSAVIDFSRPAINPTRIPQKVYMGNRIRKPGMRFLLALPGGWTTEQLPACSLPALLAATTGEISNSLEAFCKHARQQAFTTALCADSSRTVPVRLTETAEAGGQLVYEAG